jgi:alpha-L-rhamnosidase
MICRQLSRLALGCFSTFVLLVPAAAIAGPVQLKVDALAAPLGIDNPAPRFSWQLSDSAARARQTAYEIQVARSTGLLIADKPDVWSSGRISSSQSIGIRYQGPALKPSTTYFWRVKVWDAAGKPAQSNPAQWETGLMDQANWKAEWIGFLTPEENAVRAAASQWIDNPKAAQLATEKLTQERYAFRAAITLPRAVRHATLYAAGQDTVAAWINGDQVLTEQPLIGAKQMPWKKYVKADVSKQLASGANAIAIEVLHYNENPNGMATADPPAMMATLVVQYQDGTWASFDSNPGWKTAVHAPGGWTAKSFDDSSWATAALFQQSASALTEPLGKPWLPPSVKILRHEFALASPVRSARIYATALGAYTLYLNGKRVSADVMAPGWTDYRDRVPYQTYDVTSLLAEGKNALSALLAPGWYATPLEWFQQPNNYGLTPPALRAQLRIEHADGKVEWINTSTDWKAVPSWIRSAEIYDGETQDARIHPATWADVNFSFGTSNAIAVHPAPIRIVAQDFEPIRVERTIEAKNLTEPKPGIWVYDFGQNLSGVPTLRINGPEGTDVQLRFAEILNPDGTLYTENLRTAKATDHFILSGRGEDEFTPQFTFHGFRYVELTGVTAKPALSTLKVNVLHTDAPFVVKLATGSTMINQLWSNILWGQRSNFVGLPTDCPQRDERLGWTADAQVFWRTASYNMDLAAFSRKFAGDLRSTQAGASYYGIFAPGVMTSAPGSAAGWSDAGVIVPWTSWLQTGSTAIIEENWKAMESYLEAIEKANPTFLWEKESGIPFGDWLSVEGKTHQTIVATAYWAWDVTLMQQMAHATGRTEAEKHYAALFEQIRTAFQKKFVHEDAFIPGADNSPSIFGVINNPNAKATGGDTQTGYVLALHMNLLPENLRAAAAKRLVDKIKANHEMLATGFLGTPYLLEELTKAGYQDLAFKLLLNTGYPSWGYMVEHGATTMWERWNGDQMISDPSMNSYNHYAYGAVADWIYRYVAGVDATPEDVGFHTVVLNPHFDARLGHVDFDYQSPMGPIHSDWKVEGNKAVWHVTLPANTTGWLPVSTPEAMKYKMDGVPLNQNPKAKFAKQNGKTGVELQPGSYNFEIELYPVVTSSVS